MQRKQGWRRMQTCVVGFVCLVTLAGCPPSGDPLPGETRLFDGILFQWCPAGSFSMGSLVSESGHQSDESPVHAVTLTKGFWLSKYEVTQAQWESVMGDDPFLDGYPEYPIFARRWKDVRKFLNALNSQNSSVTYRLPTEAEWEYACRAGTKTRFYWGNDPNMTQIDGYEWYKGNVDLGAYPVGINPVGQKKPNPWGLHDMSGNVSELCRDWYSAYSAGWAIDPAGPSSAGDSRVVRGGSWFHDAVDCRSARRGTQVRYGQSGHVGFRLVRTELRRAPVQ